jgi:hypothetical protein
MPDPTGVQSHLNRQHRGIAWKEPCRVATTATVTISTALNSGDTIDGVTLADGDRVLVKDQSTGAENGIYVVSSSPTRAYDMDQDGTTSVVAEEIAGAVVKVLAGTVNGGTFWETTNVAGGTLGSTTITWARLNIPGGLVLLAETVLGSDTATMTLTGIPSGYRDLICIVRARTDAANDDSFMKFRVGSGSIDSGANYGMIYYLEGAAGANQVSNSGQTSVTGMLECGNNSTTGAFAVTEIQIINYASTSQFRHMLWTSGKFGAGTSGPYQSRGSAAWRNAANAIDQVSCIPDTGNFKTGSALTVYGRG